MTLSGRLVAVANGSFVVRQFEESTFAWLAALEKLDRQKRVDSERSKFGWFCIGMGGDFAIRMSDAFKQESVIHFRRH
ncbi:hypothetical protein A1359_15980 [Methylomonas lenta]|uniref:Uncharacterized protein n=1 Tax=Methylomonas lenta TaxID=980561 RepID=A0A177MZP0_9GAMM|nr:hypothetical protein [Methylomonas lenta]OAI10753.1 hypothetical protein A1359_15980 [Methylomonas lenta]